MHVIMELTDQWKEQLTAVTSKLKRTEHDQCEQLNIIHHGVSHWLDYCSTQNK